MKKLLISLLAIGLAIGVIFTGTFCAFWYIDTINNRGEYPIVGKDTYALFGDGRFVILSGGNLGLYDRLDDSEIEPHVYGYSEVGQYVYIKGQCGYTKLNYNSGEVKQSEDITDFSNEDALIFDNIEMLT